MEQNTTRKRRVDEEVRQMEFNTGDDGEEYKIKAIWNSAVYAKESELGHLPGFYYLISWKRYPKEENTWEPALAIQYLRKLISSFYKDHLDKLTMTFSTINTAPPMARPIVRPRVKPTKLPKQKRGQPANSTNK